MKILLVEPRYYTQYPPLGLLKFSTLYKQQGHQVRFVRGLELITNFVPDEIKVTSLFTWAWRPVWESVRFYRALFPRAKISLGGIYASLTPEHAKGAGADEVVAGLVPEAEDLLPDYDLVPEWHAKRAASILFSHRGCIRKCSFCAVPRLEGKPFQARPTTRISHLIHPNHHRAILWDNNILGEAGWRDVLAELHDLGLEVDFNQGLDARLITEESAAALRELDLPTIRLAYDFPQMGKQVRNAIDMMRAAGISANRIRHICCYVLYNYKDTPEDLFERIRNLLDWGVTAYPMRYQPLNGDFAFEKDSYQSPQWEPAQLEKVALARRVIGSGGAFPPYEALRRKFLDAKDFEEAFMLRPRRDRTNSLTPKKREPPPLREFAWDYDLAAMGRDHEFPTHNLELAGTTQ